MTVIKNRIPGTRRVLVGLIFTAVLGLSLTPARADLPGFWETRAPTPLSRAEAAYVFVGGKFHLVGDRLAHHVYDPVANSWSTAKQLPQDINHVQGVELGGKIYFIGGLTGWPSPHVSTVYIYNPATDTWSQGAPMPRGRGAGGVAVHNGKIYYAGGLSNGVAVPWFDVYDPAADTWTQLPDMPRAREHFHAAIVNGRFYAIGGRAVNINSFVTATDAYDFSGGKWVTGLAPIPTPRGGFAATALNNEVVIFGGEGNGKAFAEVEAYDTTTNTWRSLEPMPTPRHGIQAAVCNGGVYLATGATDQGGGNASTVHDVFFLNGSAACGGGGSASIGFGKSTLQRNDTIDQPTTLQFGPDGRLYLGLLNGTIKVYDITRNGANNYSATLNQARTTTLVKDIPNHDDDGKLNATCPSLCKRLLTGILVTGSATNPVVYATSSDPRIGGGAEGTDLNLDTNSGILSKLTWTGSAWNHQQLVRGLPRSEENHASNGLALDPATNTLFIAQGGHTNKGAPSNNFALLPEYALSGAILKVNLSSILSPPYDIPTLDDETRTGTLDANDPFGGNDGKNQAKLVAGGPVQVHAPGFRNPYDLVITKGGKMYSVDNGGNAGWGDIPVNEGPSGTCTNGPNEPGDSDPDTLHLISAGYYGGHPNPTRGNTANRFNTSNPQSPVPAANPVECDYRGPGAGSPALANMPASTNGLDEYTTTNFDGAMTGNLVAAGYVKKEVYRIKLNTAGDQVLLNEVLFSNVGIHPLDVVALGPTDPFPGTIWVADLATDSVYVFEPNDFSGGGGGGGGGSGGTCTGADDPLLDEDGDGFANADEIDNGTDPCSAGDLPSDADGDRTSDRNDSDDDNDGQLDTSDPFAVDTQNGMTTHVPVEYSWENDAPNPGGLVNTGFTGLMTNRTSDYVTFFDPDNMTVGGAAGVITVDKVPAGDAFKLSNSQKYGFQFGVVPAGSTFTVQTRIVAPFSGLTPQDHQSMGLFVGDGDQSDYAKIVTMANGGLGGIQFLKEITDAVKTNRKTSASMPGPDYVDLFLTLDPVKKTVRPSYQVTTNGVTGIRTYLGTPVGVPANWLDGSQALAVGMISTSKGPGPEFPATWDFMRVYLGA